MLEERRAAPGPLPQLDAMVASRHLLQHPFYRAWTAGQLTRQRLCDYAVQYYPHVAAFPRYLSAMHSRSADLSTRQALLENLIEEERGARNHPELWLRFAESLGVARHTVLEATPRAATRHLVATYQRLTRDAPLAAGLAALYVYEAQIPAIAAAKIDGLERFYQITDGDGLAFFKVHQQADLVHAQTCAALLEQQARSPAAHDAALHAAANALDALWRLLDGL